MNAKRNSSKYRVGMGLVLIALLCLVSGCGSVMPTAPALDATNSSQVSQSVSPDGQISDGEYNGPTEGGTDAIIPAAADPTNTFPGYVGHGHQNKKPKRH